MRISRFFTGRSETASMALSKQFPKSVQISIEDTDPPSVHPCACGCCLHRLPVSLPCLCLLRFGSTNNYHRTGTKSTDFFGISEYFLSAFARIGNSILCLLRRSFCALPFIHRFSFCRYSSSARLTTEFTVFEKASPNVR